MTVGLLDFAFLEKIYWLVAADLSKQKALDADSRAIQENVFTGSPEHKTIIYYIFKKSKETTLQFYKATASFVNSIIG